jgi:hypothetical protein
LAELQVEINEEKSDPLAGIGRALPIERQVQSVFGNKCRAFITTGTSWTVPTDLNSNNNTIETIGGGGAGGSEQSAFGAGSKQRSNSC